MTRNSGPLVSILIPAYNSERWLAAAIESALRQTWDPKEVVVVDDGSRDATLEVARRFASMGVRVVTQSNQGAARARNRAFSECSGQYIQWLDADDLLHPDKIRLQLDAGEGCGERTLLSSEWGYFFHRPQKARFCASALWCDLSPAEWMMRQMEQNLHMQTATWLVTRELTEAAGPWDPRMLVDDDGEYFCRLMLKCERIRFVPGARTYYRRSGSNGLSYIGPSDDKKDAQFLSMQLHIRYLLSLADHARSRAACRRYLQNWMIHFHPDRPDLVARVQQLAAELGGAVQVPGISWKYRWIQKTFGWNSARRAQMILPRIRHGVVRTWDRALACFGNSGW